MTGHKDGRVRVWDIRTGKKEVVEMQISKNEQSLTGLKCQNMGSQFVTVSSDS